MTETRPSLRDRLAEVVQMHEGIWLERAGRAPALLDRQARRCYRLSPDWDQESATTGEDMLGQVARFFADEADLSQRTRGSFSLHLLREDLDDLELRRGVVMLAQGLGPGSVLRVVLHFLQPPDDWSGALEWAAALQESAFGRPGKAWIELHGPFSRVNDTTKEAMFDHALQLRYTAGWWRGLSPTRDALWDADVVRDLAEFGLRVPVVWYVHDGILHMIEDLIEATLDANYDSGFAVPLVCTNVYYRWEPGEPVPAEDLAGYLRLLSRVYQRYPYTDDVLAPIAELAQLALSGRRDRAAFEPCVDLVARRDGVAVYRQIPALARLWKGWPELWTIESSEIKAELAGFCRQQFSDEGHPRCGGCRLRHLCGGSDIAESGREDAYQTFLEIICQYCRMFLEAFLWQRLKLGETAGGQAQTSPG